MWILVIPAAIIAAAWAYGMSKTTSKNVPISQLPAGQTGQSTGGKYPTGLIVPTASPIVAGDYVVVDTYGGGIAIPGMPTGKILMQIDSLDAPMDQMKQYVMAHITDNRVPAQLVGSMPVRRTGIVKATAQDIAIAQQTMQSATAYSPFPGPSPEYAAAMAQTTQLQQAAIQAAKNQQSGSGIQAATMYNPAPGPAATTANEFATAAEKARINAMNKLVPETTTPEALAVLLALGDIPSAGPYYND